MWRSSDLMVERSDPVDGDLLVETQEGRAMHTQPDELLDHVYRHTHPRSRFG